MNYKKQRLLWRSSYVTEKSLFTGRTSKSKKLTKKELNVLWARTRNLELHIVAQGTNYFRFSYTESVYQDRVLKVCIHGTIFDPARTVIKADHLYGDDDTKIGTKYDTILYRKFLSDIGLYLGTSLCELEREDIIETLFHGWEDFYV